MGKWEFMEKGFIAIAIDEKQKASISMFIYLIIKLFFPITYSNINNNPPYY